MPHPSRKSISVSLSDPVDLPAATATAASYIYPNVAAIPELSVVVRGDYEAVRSRNHVAILTGGGGGHEPFPFGFVGEGMATAAIAGNVFSAPSKAMILEALLKITGSAGALVVYLNFSGDKLAFTGAIDEAKKSYGLKVEGFCVSDDVTLPEGCRRGLAGVIPLLKVVGAAAEAGSTLPAVYKMCQMVSDNIFTAAVGFAPVVLPFGPDAEAPTRREELHFEMGVGIHGESGCKPQDIQEYLTPSGVIHVTKVATSLVEALKKATSANQRQDGVPEETQHCVLLVNNLGGLTIMEVSLIAKEVVDQLRSVAGLASVRISIGRFMTSLDMPGVSVSVTMLNDLRLKLYDSPTGAGAFPVPTKLKGGLPLPPICGARTRHGSIYEEGTSQGPEADCIKTILAHLCDAIIGAEGTLTDLDTSSGDGDCGINFARAATKIKEALEKEELPLVSVSNKTVAPVLFVRIGEMFGEFAGGSTGAIYAELMGKIANALGTTDMNNSVSAVAAVDATVTNFCHERRIQVGARTMFDAMIPASEALKKAVVDRGLTVAEGLAEAAKAADAGAETTKHLVPKVGKAMFVPEKKFRGKMDPGAYAVSVWTKGLADASAV